MNPSISHELLESLKLTRMGFTEMESLTGLKRHVLVRWVRNMRAANLVRVGALADDGRGRLVVPQFEFGSEPDVQRPTPKTAAERMSASRKRQRDAYWLQRQQSSLRKATA